MAQVAIEAVKIIRDVDGIEEVFEPDSDVSSLPSGVLVESAKVLHTGTGLEEVFEAGSHRGGHVVPPNNTTFVSASVSPLLGTAKGTDIIVILSDALGHDSVSDEWKVNIGSKHLQGSADLAVSGHGTNTFTIYIRDAANHVQAGDVVRVSHIVADSGIVKFNNKPVTNSLV